MSFSPLASRKNACLFLAVFLCCFSISAFAQDKKAEDKPKPDVPFPGAKWVKGPNAADIGGIAEVKLNEGWVATDGNGARMMLEASQNLTSGKEIGLVGSSDLAWCVLFEFDEVGYVKDDEKNSLDAPKMMKSMQSSQEAANKELKKRGWPSMEIVGWQKEPLYNATTHNLEWGLRIKGEQSTQETINYNVRVLGRKGVMVVTLLVNPEKMDASMPEFEKMLSSFSFKQGNRYAEYVSGDKIAKYGLTALVVGGGAALAAKAGLFKYLWKIILVAGIALASVGKKILDFFKNFMGIGRRPGE